MPDLSSSPRPSFTILSYCFLVASASGSFDFLLFGEFEGDAGIFGGMRGAEEAGMFAILHVFAVGLQDARIGAGLRKNFAEHREVKAERLAEAEAFREAGGVDVHDHVDERFDVRGLAGGSDVTHRSRELFENRFGAIVRFAFAAEH
jgi:hypothetical protein